MSTEHPKFQVGDSILIVSGEHEGDLGTIIAIADDHRRYLVVFENGARMVFPEDSLSHRS